MNKQELGNYLRQNWISCEVFNAHDIDDKRIDITCEFKRRDLIKKLDKLFDNYSLSTQGKSKNTWLYLHLFELNE